MSAETAQLSSSIRRLRVDLDGPDPRDRRALVIAAVLALGAGFVLIGGGNLDLGPDEARLGMAAAEGPGPFGQNFGGWEPGLWPVPVATSWLWGLGEDTWPTAASVRWPAAIAGVLLGLILARRLGAALGGWSGLWMGACWFGSLALIDRSAGLGLDLIAGLGAVACLDRIIGRGADAVAGAWAALAFLSGGWPPLALIALATVVLGRHGQVLSLRLAWPVVLAVVAWSAWALAVAPAEAWASALALPLTHKPVWAQALSVPWTRLPGLAAAWVAVGLVLKSPLGVVVLGLPWSPFAALVASREVRSGWTEPGKGLVIGWLQAAGACLVAGTLVPGLAEAARVPALAGLAVASAAACHRAWSGGLSDGPRRTALRIALGLATLWALLAAWQGSSLAATVGYYRPVAILLMALALATIAVAVASAWLGRPRWALGATLALAVGLKLAHWGVYVPEWNYRFSQGPWGRAIGQWVPPRWPIYTVHAWQPDLAFATERPVRQLANPFVLNHKTRNHPLFVLLHPAEFDHWPEDAPRLIKVREFEDEHGAPRVLARTEGDLSRVRVVDLD